MVSYAQSHETCSATLNLIHVAVRQASNSQSLFSVKPFTGDGGFGALAAGAAIAAYSFLGFDAVSTMSDETHDAERNIPRALVLVALIGGVVFIVVAYSTTLVSPGGSFDNVDSLASDVAKTIGGSLFGVLLFAALIIAQVTSGLAAQAAVARLLFAMGRDRALPKRVFGLASEKFRTPWSNIGLAGLIGLGAVFLDIYLLTQLDSKALILGGSWLGIGIVYLFVLTRGLTRQPPDLAGVAEADWLDITTGRQARPRATAERRH